MHSSTHLVLLQSAQVADSEVGPDGRPPKRCLVSSATRRELTGWRYRRITRGKAKVGAVQSSVFSESTYS